MPKNTLEYDTRNIPTRYLRYPQPNYGGCGNSEKANLISRSDFVGLFHASD